MELDNVSVAERKPINVPNSIKRTSMNPSLTSSIDNVIYPPSHQYHYIQYYQQLPPQQQQQFQLQQQHQYVNPSAALMSATTSCQCSCSCGNQAQQLQLQQQQQQQQQQKHHAAHHSHQSSVDSQMVNVIVHRQASGSNSSSSNENTSTNTKTNSSSITSQALTHNPDLPKKSQSETSLLNHSYQALKMSESLTENIFDCASGGKKKLKRTSSCDCDLECTCVENDNDDVDDEKLGEGTEENGPNKRNKRRDNHHHNTHLSHKQQFVLSEAMLTADEITVSESDNNSTTVKRCERNQSNKSKSPGKNSNTDELNYHNANNIDIYSDGDAEAITEACLKETNGIPNGGSSDLRPPLPPRPPPRPKTVAGSLNARARPGMVIKKYVIWCLVCGGFSCILGLLFLGVYFLLHSYTITVGNFETVPTFVPATLLILTGLCVMSLARRRNRYSYLIKLSGACGLISALTCALVTVTTTVLHMSRLQALRECEYAQKTRTCTCYSDLIESQVDRVDKEGVRLVFDSLSDCGVVHGSLYSCLRAIFGLSVAGVLVAVFSCMLVYQLLSHERKKMYWEQLELRCRSLYTRPQMPPQNMAAVAAPHGCRCCEQCHAHRQAPLQTSAYPWDESTEPRFWSTQPPGNFYSPNPGGDDLTAMATNCRSHELSTSRSRGTGWSWNRWWQRNSPDPNSRFRQTPSSPDSQYGFSNSTNMPVNNITEEVVNANPGQFNIIPNNLPYGVWGPPPPYSDPNSPARRGYYQYIQPTHHLNTATGPPNVNNIINSNTTDLAHGQFMEQPAASNCCQQSSMPRSTNSVMGSVGNFKSKGEYENTPSDSDCGANVRERDRFSNTLPTRKIKKRLEPGNKSIGPNSQSSQRINVQQVFANVDQGEDEQEYHEPQSLGEDSLTSVQRNKCGVENNGFQNSCESTNAAQNADQQIHSSSDPAESEVYFADVSSCCNMSVKNDHYYEDTRASQRTLIPPNQQHHVHGHSHTHHHHHTHAVNAQHQLNNCSSSNNEDYLAQRFGQRENSIRSRLPFPQNPNVVNDGFVENLKMLTTTANKDNQQLNHAQIPKDTSRQSMCSVDSEAKTEFTDLSPLTPCSNKISQLQDFVEASSQGATTPTNFVASYPFSSESQSLEAHRRSTKNLTEAHYEVIDDQQTGHQVGRNIGRTTNKPKSNIKHAARERKDNSDREWSSDNSNGERHKL
ncbi:uncharacterized protein LOC111684616 isoform X1 [Lucilia cuprina]|uniref:uncharacterized protein LOC111684616 isoform X1 n=1 Tax=Lucilia cuprina TaxID=7375 RepID=UPI001F05B132|nr:uncharacterized protein LOC111684616 isoform X1 [Lucilia cuprina]